MDAKFRVGDLVRTIKGSIFEVAGEIVEITQPSSDVQLLWGDNEPHYLIRDMKTKEYVSAIERMLEEL